MSGNNSTLICNIRLGVGQLYSKPHQPNCIIIILNNFPDGYGSRIVESECECGCNRYREPQTEEEEEEEEETEFGPDKQEREMLL